VFNTFRWQGHDVASRLTQFAEIVLTHPAVWKHAMLEVPEWQAYSSSPQPKTTQPSPAYGANLFPSTFKTILSPMTILPVPSTNSDLELCGNIAQHEVIAPFGGVRKCTIHMLSDNVASLF